MIAALVIAAYVVVWVLATAVAGPSIRERERHWMTFLDWSVASVTALTWPFWSLVLPFVAVGWLASKFGGHR